MEKEILNNQFQINNNSNKIVEKEKKCFRCQQSFQLKWVKAKRTYSLKNN
jgi:uncharacterized protein YxjI